ncbi:MAG: dipeptide transport system permease protein DppB [Phycisphaerae bacterium]|jgi:ABC-type dipeptide/oligopeptide/nickel transport system permease component|nr:MAG: dipeptide transport system permease protein DppB [Phycisphaerae bacterium]
MWKFIAIRVLQFPLILGVIYLLTFTLVWIAPGDPYTSERNVDPMVLEQMKQRDHADRWYKFLVYYPWRIITQGDFGRSMVNREFSISEKIAQGLPISLTIGLVALVIAVLVGMTMGTLSAVRRDGIVDYAGLSLTLIGISVPSFVTASVLVLVFGAWFRWIRPGSFTDVQDVIWPALALSLMPMAYIVRLQRVSMLDVLGADYVRTARAKGLSRTRVVIKHCLRNAFLPVFSYLGPAAAVALTGSFVVERVFGLESGLGRLFVDSVTSRDRTMVMGLTLLYAFLLLVLNLMIDIGYVIIDPRIDLGEKKT